MSIKKLIEQIGDPFFSICDQENMHPHHPDTIRIADCEYDQWIEVHSDNGPEATLEMAQALVTLLNIETVSDRTR